MGSRANVFVRDEQGEALYYAHWGAQSMPAKLFWGPEVALAYARELPKRNIRNEWLDDVWSEGGVAMDCVARRLVWYGGEDIQYDARLRKLYLALQAVSWPGWEIQWAADGVLDLVRLARVGRERVMFPEPPMVEADPVPDFLPVDWMDAVVVHIDAAARWRVWGTDVGPEAPMVWGSRLAQQMGETELPDSLIVESGSLSWGLLIDTPRRHVAMYLASPLEDAPSRLLAPWSGWEPRWLGDDEDAFLALTDGRVQRPVPSAELQLETLRKIVSQKGVGPEWVLQAVEGLAKRRGASQVKVNPNALTPEPQIAIDADALFADVVRRWRMQREERFDI